MTVHAVVPGMGDTFPLLALQVYSPASDSCTSVSVSVERVTFPSSLSGPPLVVITRWSVTFGSRTMPFLSQVTSGGEDPLASHVSSTSRVNSSNDRTSPWDKLWTSEPSALYVILAMFGLTVK